MLQFLLRTWTFPWGSPWGTPGEGPGLAYVFLARRREGAIEKRHSSSSFLQPEDLLWPTADRGFLPSTGHRIQDIALQVSSAA